MGSLQNGTAFIILSLFDLYILILLLRLVFQYLRVDYYNPFSQFIIKVTNPLIVPLRRIIPGWSGIDFATVVVILLSVIVKITLITLVTVHKLPSFIGLFLWTLGDIASLTIKLFFYAILVNVILSWVAPLSRSPMTAILYSMTEPFMRPARRMIPPIGGFDISPIFVMIFLELIIIVLADPLIQTGFQMAVR